MASRATQEQITHEAVSANVDDLRENDPARLARLNDYAEIMIWGSNGRNVYTFDNPNNDFLLLATKANPLRGILEVVQDEPYSLRDKPQAERDKAAEKRHLIASTYELTLLAFVELGDELTVAKAKVDNIIVGMPLPERPRRVLLQKELREKRRAVYLANGGELPFEDSDVPENIEFVNYKKAPLAENVDSTTYDLLPEWLSFMRLNVLNAFGDEWPRRDIGSVIEGVTYQIQDVNDGTGAEAEPGMLHYDIDRNRMPYTPFHPKDRSQWHTW